MEIVNTLWFYNFPQGRLGNSFFEYLYINFFEKEIDAKVIIGNYHNQYSKFPTKLFEIKNYLDGVNVFNDVSVISKFTAGLDRANGPRRDLEIIQNYFQKHPGTVLAVDGYFQYDTKFIFEIPGLEKLLYQIFYPDDLGTIFQKKLKIYIEKIKNKFKNKTLITIHARRGDYLLFNPPGSASHAIHPYFHTLDLEKLQLFMINFLTINRITNPIVYVASDDLEFCKSFFQGQKIEIATAEEIVEREKSSELEFLVCDLAGMAAANFMVASNSTYSIMGALLNPSARLFLRQTQDGHVLPFDPRNTVISYGQ
jgi:hypothetical protein